MATPPLNALRALEAVARLGSFRAAAESLFVTQSAISHQIRNIEDWLQKPLFEREGNRTRLLPHGVDLARSLTAAFAEIDTACNRARDRKPSQALVIAAIPSVATCWLIPRLSRFRTAHPEVEFRIVYAMHGRDINFNDVDLAFVFSKGKPEFPQVETQLFLDAKNAPVCSPSLLQRLGKRPETPVDFQQMGLLHDGSTDGWKAWLQGSMGGGAAHSALTFDGATFEDFNLLRAAALSGQGVALCPLSIIKPDLDNGSLVQVSDHLLVDGYDYYLLSAPTEDPRILHQAALFRAWVLAERELPLISPRQDRFSLNDA